MIDVIQNNLDEIYRALDRQDWQNLGLEVNGKRISFAENVFHRFRDGKIAEVWSIRRRAGDRSAALPVKNRSPFR